MGYILKRKGNKNIRNKIIYIPTITGRVKGEHENVLYSPNKNHPEIILGKNITIWDNYTFYFYKRYRKSDKHEVAREHYLWLINFIKDNWREGITLITPDVEWLKYKDEIIEKWNNECYLYPQLYVPNTWENPNKVNIIGYAPRKTSPNITHKNWTHCLGHTRDINCKLLTYDSIIERT